MWVGRDYHYTLMNLFKNLQSIFSFRVTNDYREELLDATTT